MSKASHVTKNILNALVDHKKGIIFDAQELTPATITSIHVNMELIWGGTCMSDWLT